MSRLLFAAARGARVQALIDIQSKCQCVNCGAINKFDGEERLTLDTDAAMAIHTDDLHLQYGPISTGLRDYAFRGERDYPYTYMTVVNAPLGSWWMRVDDTNAFEACGSKLHRSLFLLFLAEALADEGL